MELTVKHNLVYCMSKSQANTFTPMLAGAAKTDITPPLGTYINGDFVAHYATRIHDQLYAKSLVLQCGDTIVALVVVDICVIEKELVDETKGLIKTQTGIPYEHILISATHTHAGGSVASVYLSAADIHYMRALPALIARSVTAAKLRMQPSRLAFGNVDVPAHARCRRFEMKESYTPLNPVNGTVEKVKTNPFGNENLIVRSVASPDPEVSYIAVQDLSGNWISVLANYSMHYVGDWDNGTISSDYFGVFSKRIQDKLKAGDDFIGIMSNGTSGDINIWDFLKTGNYPSGNFKKSELIGNDLAEKVFNSLDQAQWENEPVIEVRYEDLAVKLRKPSNDELERAKQIMAKTNYEGLQADDEGLRGIYAREQVLLNELPAQLLLPMQAIKIGNVIIGALGGEIFAETGLWLKANSPAEKYFTIGLANGNLGYVPPAHEMQAGGYETWRSRTSKLQEHTEQDMRNRMLSLLLSFTEENK